jgi:hypothetical protein
MPSNRPVPAPERRTRRHLLAAVLVAMLASGCSAFQKREPMTLEQVVELSREGKSADDIINRLRESRTVLAISGSGFAKLREQGVDDAVLDHIQRSYVTSVEMETRMRYQGWYGPGFGVGYYPYPYRPMGGPWPYWYAW